MKAHSIQIAATLGDPTSIGPEVGIKSISKILKSKPDLTIHLFAPIQFVSLNRNPRLIIHDPKPSRSKYRAGQPSQASAKRALEDLERATDFCLAHLDLPLVTGPLDKSLCAKINPSFRGHTEYLQKKARVAGTTMLLSGASLRVALVTTHLPLKLVSSKLTKAKIIETTLRVHSFCKRFTHRPRIAILSLNPHASDHGLFGSEERTIIEPAIRSLKASGLVVSGPFPSDSFFHKTAPFDAVIAMYHDQGLIPLKMRHFYDAVNITLGLPFLRTSVDHGTAFDIAGKNKASSLSYAKALDTAYRFAKTTRRH